MLLVVWVGNMMVGREGGILGGVGGGDTCFRRQRKHLADGFITTVCNIEEGERRWEAK